MYLRTREYIYILQLLYPLYHFLDKLKMLPGFASIPVHFMHYIYIPLLPLAGYWKGYNELPANNKGKWGSAQDGRLCECCVDMIQAHEMNKREPVLQPHMLDRLCERLHSRTRIKYEPQQVHKRWKSLKELYDKNFEHLSSYKPRQVHKRILQKEKQDHKRRFLRKNMVLTLSCAHICLVTYN